MPRGRVAGGRSLLGEPGLGVGIRPVANKSQISGTKGLRECGESTRGRGSLCLPPAPALPLLLPPGAAEGARRAHFGLATTPQSSAPCALLVAVPCQSSDLPAAPRCQRTPGLATGAGSGSRLVESTSSCLRAAMRRGSCQPWCRTPRSSSNPAASSLARAEAGCAVSRAQGWFYPSQPCSGLGCCALWSLGFGKGEPRGWDPGGSTHLAPPQRTGTPLP